MGSEGAPITKFHITGFKKFHGVVENPTEIIVSRLKDYMKERGLPPGCSIESCTVLETAGLGALDTLLCLLDAACPKPVGNVAPLHRKLGDFLAGDDPSSSNGERVIWVHFGVNSGATKFAIERRAVNEATFRCPDELGWQPQRLAIVAEDGPLSNTRETRLHAMDIVKHSIIKGFDTILSDDAGRFVCNYVYYHSLRHADSHGTLCLFVHVPLFSKIDEKTQMQFVGTLLEVLSTTW